MTTLAQELWLQSIRDSWKIAAAEAIYELMRGDNHRRFMFLWD